MKKLHLTIIALATGMFFSANSLAVTVVSHQVVSPAGTKVTLIALDWAGDKQFGEKAIREGSASFLVTPATKNQLGQQSTFQTSDGTKYIAETPKDLRTLDRNHDNKLSPNELSASKLMIATSNPDGTVKVVSLNDKNITTIDIKNKGKSVNLDRKGEKSVVGKLITTKTFKATAPEPTTVTTKKAI